MLTKNFGTKKYIILSFALFLLNIFFICYNFKINSLTFGKTFILTLILSALLEIALCFFLYFAKKHSWKIEKIFLFLALILGSVYTLALPVGRAPDEASHFFRIYEITEGHFVSVTSDETFVPGSYESSEIYVVEKFANNNVTYSEILDTLGIATSDEKTFIPTSAYGYSPLSYLPQLAGVFLGKLLHLPFLVTAYLGKFANLIFCIVVLYFCIKHTPLFKKLIFLLAFLPISMQSMCSLSADAPIFVSAIAFICFILYAIYNRALIFSKKHYFLIFALCLMLTISKIVYAPLCLLLFAIPRERFGGKKQKLLWIFGAGAFVIAVYAIWFFISPSTITTSDPSVQTSLILHNPFYYFAIVLASIAKHTILYLGGAFGGYLEWFNVVPSALYIIPLFTIFVILCVKYRENYTIPKNLKIFAIALFSLITLAIFTAMFITWTRAGEIIIDGVQGRYFLPIMLLVPLFFLPTEKTAKKPRPLLAETENYYLYTFLIFESIYIITTIASTHF